MLPSDWTTPGFVRIKEKRTTRISSYLEYELWERDEILTAIKYERFMPNKAALSLLWDLNARNHEIALLKIKHIKLERIFNYIDDFRVNHNFFNLFIWFNQNLFIRLDIL